MTLKVSKKIGTGIMALLITVFLIPVVAGAFGPGDGKGGKEFGRGGQQRSALGIWRNPQIVQNLGLTKEQVEKIRDADFTSREKRLTLKAGLDGLRLKMDKEFSVDSVNDAAVLSLAKKMSDLKGKMFVQRIESRLVLTKLLNADQLEKLQLYKMQQKRKGRSHGQRRIPRDNTVEESATENGQTN